MSVAARAQLAVALVLLLCTACRSTVNTDEARAYPCDRNASDDCPAGMRCGLEDRCHGIGDAKDWLCNADDDCEADWRCGLSLPGSDRRCHSRDVASDYICKADTDCQLNWRCGKNERCHSRTVAAAYQCDENPDCEGGWRCGLERTCHDPAVAAPLLCTNDGHCEQGYRCGPEGRCLDVSFDALPTVTPAALTLARVSPLATFAGVDKLDASRIPNRRTEPMAYAFTQGSQLTQISQYLVPSPLTDGGVGTAESITLTVPGVLDLAAMPKGQEFDVVPHTYVLRADGVSLLQLKPGIAPFTSLGFGQGATRLRSLQRWQTPGSAVFALAPRKFWIKPTTRAVVEVTVPASDGGAQRIYDVSAFKHQSPNGNGTDSAIILAAAEEGLFGIEAPNYAPAAGGWFKLQPATSDVGGSCVGTASLDPVTLLSVSGEPYNEPIQNFHPVGLWAGTRGPGLPSGSPLASTLHLMSLPRIPLQSQTCDAMTQGFTRSCEPCEYAFSAFQVSGVNRAFVTCEAQGGGQQTRYVGIEMDGGCSSPDRYVQLGPLVAYSGTNMEAGAIASADGQLAVDDGYEPLFLDVPRGLVFRRAGKLELAHVPGFDSPSRLYREEPGIGLMRAATPAGYQPFDFRGAVEGRREWVFVNQIQGAPTIVELGALTQRTVARVTGVTSSPRTGFSALLAYAPDGGEHLIAAADDKLFAARMASPDAGLIASLQMQLVPEPYVNIRSIAVMSPPLAEPDGKLPTVSGYALTANALFYFSHRTDVQWRFRDVPVPEKDALEVWTDGPRGRIGYADGEVYSLPNRVKLADALSEVIDFAGICGESFALTRGGLYRLVPTAGFPVGKWQPVPLDSVAAADPSRFEAGQLVVDNTGLLLFDAFGTVTRINVTGCATPLTAP